MTPVLIVLIIAAALVLIWNVVPPVRERLRGWTTVLDAAVFAALPFIAELIDAFAETGWRSFIPKEHWPYIVAALALWFMFKRAVTRTGLGTR